MLINERIDDSKIIEELSGTNNRQALYRIGDKVDCTICDGAMITRVTLDKNWNGEAVYDIKYTDNNGNIQTDMIYECDIFGMAA